MVQSESDLLIHKQIANLGAKIHQAPTEKLRKEALQKLVNFVGFYTRDDKLKAQLEEILEVNFGRLSV